MRYPVQNLKIVRKKYFAQFSLTFVESKRPDPKKAQEAQEISLPAHAATPLSIAQ